MDTLGLSRHHVRVAFNPRLLPLHSPAFTKFADLINVSVDGGVEIFKLACLVGKADVIGINEFPAHNGWQIIDVQKTRQ